MRAAAQFKNLPSPQRAAENGGWSAFLPGTPVAADALTFDAAIGEMTMALGEYLADCTCDSDEHRTTATTRCRSGQ